MRRFIVRNFPPILSIPIYAVLTFFVILIRLLTRGLCPPKHYKSLPPWMRY